MDEKRRHRRDFVQNIVITVLALSAAVLMAQTQLYNLGSAAGARYLSGLLSPQEAAPGGQSQQAFQLTAPVRVAVTGAYGRHGDIMMTTADEEFLLLGNLLGEALGSARSYVPVDQAAFLAALGRTSVYYDFLAPLPVSVLAEFTGTTAQGQHSARRLIVAEEETGVRLYLWDDGVGFGVCETAVSAESLAAAVGQYELGNAVFAMDRSALDPAHAALAPWSLLLSDTLPEVPVLEASEDLGDSDTLLAALKFNPRTNYRYTDSGGTEVVVDGERSLRIRPDGTALYLSGGESALTAGDAEDGTLTVSQAVTAAGNLVGGLLTDAGDAGLYLQEVYQSAGSTVVRFGYQVGGVPIRYTDGGCAAEVLFDGNAVSTMSLRFRTYTLTSDTSLLLPLRQALAVAARTPGAELAVSYADSGASLVSACWMAE